MAGNALEQDIIGLYSDNLSSIYSINQIATKLGKKYPYINKKVTILIKNKIFKKVVVGRSHLCSLNLKNDEAIYMLILNEIRKKQQFLENEPHAEQLLDYLTKIANASGSLITLEHDGIIFLVASNKETKTRMDNSILKQGMEGYQYQIITKGEFINLLREDKLLHENHTLLLGFEKYYECIREIEDELRLRYSKITP